MEDSKTKQLIVQYFKSKDDLHEHLDLEEPFLPLEIFDEAIFCREGDKIRFCDDGEEFSFEVLNFRSMDEYLIVRCQDNGDHFYGLFLKANEVPDIDLLIDPID